MDQFSYRLLSQLNLPNLSLIAIADLENGDTELLDAKRNRSPIEYYFTCTPSLLLYALNNYPEVDLITYLDSDLFFFADPTPVYNEINASSIAIIGHRFPPSLRDLEQYGIYNVGWLSFRRDQHGVACLRWWRERCIEWCYDRCENGRFADQKYLDDWPDRFPRVAILRHKGANLAPWNLANYRIRGEGSRVWVDEQPLIFFHFHGLKQIGDWAVEPSLPCYNLRASSRALRNIYSPYIRTLAEIRRTPEFQSSEILVPTGVRWVEAKCESSVYVPISHRTARRLRELRHLWQGIRAGKYFLVINGRVI
jgi:hypothetical protein